VHSKPFHFKQFTIHHDENVMPVGTDSVLLGSWVDVVGANQVLDVGCGTGLLSLMIAQRNSGVKIMGIDKSRDAVKLTRVNATHSPWSSRIVAERQDILRMKPSPKIRFDTLVSNPPYFSSGTHPHDEFRDSYRHTTAYFFNQFFWNLHKISSPSATLNIIIPHVKRKRICLEALNHSWYLKRELRVRHSKNENFTLSLLEWSKQCDEAQALIESMTLFQSNGKKTPAYHKMTRAFYLSE